MSKDKQNTFLNEWFLTGSHIHRIKESSKTLDVLIRDFSEELKRPLNKMTVQIFASGPVESKIKLSETEMRNIHAFVNKGLRLYLHSTYLANPWPSAKKPAFGLHLIKQELFAAGELGAKGVIVHLARGNTSQEIAAVCERLLPTFITCNKNYKATAKLFLEVVPTDNTDLNEIWIYLSSEMKKYIGFCIDTAHLWAAGIDIGSAKKIRSYFSNLPNDAPLFIHLNDQVYDFDSKRDQHTKPLNGTLFKDETMIIELLSILKEKNADSVVELKENLALECLPWMEDLVK